jgi:excisionase family DNA binding protein
VHHINTEADTVARARKVRAPTTPPITLTVNDACVASGLSRSTLYQLIRGGTVCSTRVAGRRLIFAASLQAFLGA